MISIVIISKNEESLDGTLTDVIHQAKEPRRIIRDCRR